MYYALIMAGGSGTRLWPLSRQDRPKQTLRLVGEWSVFQFLSTAAIFILALTFRTEAAFATVLENSFALFIMCIGMTIALIAGCLDLVGENGFLF